MASSLRFCRHQGACRCSCRWFAMPMRLAFLDLAAFVVRPETYPLCDNIGPNHSELIWGNGESGDHRRCFTGSVFMPCAARISML